MRASLGEVTRLREDRSADPRLLQAVRSVKRLQARRFEGSYADLLQGGTFAAAARFFLDHLYGDRDDTERDAQFGRVAGALERLFPPSVVETAQALGELHELTETLDHAMGQAWCGQPTDRPEVVRYVAAWQTFEHRTRRAHQLESVLRLGADLGRLTRTPGLRTLLRMMRKPAQAAGLGALQIFLETGFDTFAALARQRGSVDTFMDEIRRRESTFLALLFDADAVACETELTRLLGQVR